MEQRFQVLGMSCGHCVRNVTDAVHGIDPGATVQVDLAAHVLLVASDADRDSLGTAISQAGYDVETVVVP